MSRLPPPAGIEQVAIELATRSADTEWCTNASGREDCYFARPEKPAVSI
jgi:hypothetical protein